MGNRSMRSSLGRVEWFQSRQPRNSLFWRHKWNRMKSILTRGLHVRWVCLNTRVLLEHGHFRTPLSWSGTSRSKEVYLFPGVFPDCVLSLSLLGVQLLLFHDRVKYSCWEPRIPLYLDNPKDIQNFLILGKSTLCTYLAKERTTHSLTDHITPSDFPVTYIPAACGHLVSSGILRSPWTW